MTEFGTPKRPEGFRRCERKSKLTPILTCGMTGRLGSNPTASKDLLRRFLDPQNIRKAPSEEVGKYSKLEKDRRFQGFAVSHTAATFRWRYDEFQKLRSGEKMKLDVLGIASGELQSGSENKFQYT